VTEYVSLLFWQFYALIICCFNNLSIYCVYLKKYINYFHVGVQIILQDVVFPLLCHSSEDELLWSSDPIEYIRTKYGEMETVL